MNLYNIYVQIILKNFVYVIQVYTAHTYSYVDKLLFCLRLTSINLCTALSLTQLYYYYPHMRHVRK